MPIDHVLGAVAVVVAAALGWFGPRVVAALPEPESPDPDKPTYVDLAQVRHLAPALALASAVLVAAVAWVVPVELLPAWVAFLVVGAWLAYVDARTRLLPFALTALLHVACLLLVGLAALLTLDLDLLVRALAANLVVFVVFWLVWAVGRRFGGGAFGYGDVRLAAIAGLVLGAVGGREALVGSYAAFLIGGVAGILLALARLVDARSYAFGPYLVLGAVAGVLVPALT